MGCWPDLARVGFSEVRGHSSACVLRPTAVRGEESQLPQPVQAVLEPPEVRCSGVVVDGFRPDRYDLLGAVICVAGVVVMVAMVAPSRG